MSLVLLSLEEKLLVEAIVSSGSVPDMIEVDPTYYLSQRDIRDIEDFANSNSDQKTKTYINNILRDNK